MGDLGGRSGLRAGTLAGLIGVDAALNTPHDGRAQHAGESGFHIECGPEDEPEDLRNLREVHAHDHHGNHDINERHEWHDNGGEGRNTLDAANNDDGQNARQDDGCPGGVDAPGGIGRGGHRIGLDCRQEVAGSQDHGDGKHDAIDHHEWRGLSVLVGLFDVIGGPAAVLTGVLILFLVNLRQRTFDERGGRAQKRHCPHPEHGARPTEGDGCGHAGDIAHAHAARERDHQGLEGRHAIRGLFSVNDLLEHVRYTAHLQAACHHGEINTRAEA